MVQLVPIDPDVYRLAYDVVSNSVLWWNVNYTDALGSGTGIDVPSVAGAVHAVSATITVHSATLRPVPSIARIGVVPVMT